MQLNRAQRRYLTAGQVKVRYGDISDMSLWRWIHDPKVGFPQPITVNRRRLFDEEELDEFDRRRREERQAPGAAA
jgi:hypothetical protein